ncbi:MAG: ribonuclease D [Deltaproteobacteria bacterium]|nr:ribonuclease D [Deltaproteobacteria bacterium]
MSEEIPLWMVEDAETLDRMVARLAKATVIGVDTESDSMYHYREKVCLIQFSDLHTDYIVDPLKIDDLSPLGPIFASPSICKIFHGADFDVVSLTRDFGFEINGIFDTMIASQMLGFPKVGLADLIGRFFGEVIDKKYQRHDWSSRPLLEEHLDYAKGDTHWLLAIREILIRRLRRAGKLRHVREEGELLSRRRWEHPKDDKTAFLRVKQASTLDTRELRILRKLYVYRDEQARRMDRPVYKVIPDGVLIDVARAAPRSADDLDRVIPGMHGLKRRHRSALLAAVEEGLADTQPIPRQRRKGPSREKIPVGLQGKSAERALLRLKEWRKELMRRNPGLAPATTASNSVLANVARYRPTSLEELAEVPDVRRWQVRDFGEALLEVLDEIDPPKGNG